MLPIQDWSSTARNYRAELAWVYNKVVFVQKVIAEKQDLRDQNTALKRENEALVADHGEQRIGWREQGLWKEREEVLLSENQHLKDINKE